VAAGRKTSDGDPYCVSMAVVPGVTVPGITSVMTPSVTK
jgi:hypothetical protein